MRTRRWVRVWLSCMLLTAAAGEVVVAKRKGDEHDSAGKRRRLDGVVDYDPIARHTVQDRHRPAVLSMRRPVWSACM